MLVALLQLCAELGFEDPSNRCLVCTPTNIAVREVSERFIRRLRERPATLRMQLSQVALIATENRADVTWDDERAKIFLDYRKKRVKRVARFWLGEGVSAPKPGLSQLPWVGPGKDALTALLQDPVKAQQRYKWF